LIGLARLAPVTPATSSQESSGRIIITKQISTGRRLRGAHESTSQTTCVASADRLRADGTLPYRELVDVMSCSRFATMTKSAHAGWFASQEDWFDVGRPLNGRESVATATASPNVSRNPVDAR
jgi:hypothetical protein